MKLSIINKYLILESNAKYKISKSDLVFIDESITSFGSYVVKNNVKVSLRNFLVFTLKKYVDNIVYGKKVLNESKIFELVLEFFDKLKEFVKNKWEKIKKVIENTKNVIYIFITLIKNLKSKIKNFLSGDISNKIDAKLKKESEKYKNFTSKLREEFDIVSNKLSEDLKFYDNFENFLKKWNFTELKIEDEKEIEKLSNKVSGSELKVESINYNFQLESVLIENGIKGGYGLLEQDEKENKLIESVKKIIIKFVNTFLSKSKSFIDTILSFIKGINLENLSKKFESIVKNILNKIHKYEYVALVVLSVVIFEVLIHLITETSVANAISSLIKFVGTSLASFTAGISIIIFKALGDGVKYLYLTYLYGNAFLIGSIFGIINSVLCVIVVVLIVMKHKLDTAIKQ